MVNTFIDEAPDNLLGGFSIIDICHKCHGDHQRQSAESTNQCSAILAQIQTYRNTHTNIEIQKYKYSYLYIYLSQMSHWMLKVPTIDVPLSLHNAQLGIKRPWYFSIVSYWSHCDMYITLPLNAHCNVKLLFAKNSFCQSHKYCEQ